MVWGVTCRVTAHYVKYIGRRGNMRDGGTKWSTIDLFRTKRGGIIIGLPLCGGQFVHVEEPKGSKFLNTTRPTKYPLYITTRVSSGTPAAVILYICRDTSYLVLTMKFGAIKRFEYLAAYDRP